jgi:hypothetical protein
MQISKCFAVAGLIAALSACAETPLVHVGNQVFNLGQGLPDDMVNRHMAAVVGFDEVWTANYQRIARNVLYAEGVERGTPEYDYRVARINLNNTEGGLWVKKGSLLFMTGAYVPDHLPQLRAGDIVEVRQTGTWHVLKDFAKTGEANIVVRILCAKADPDYKQCLKRQPKTGEFEGVGATGTPYPASVRDYGFTFTPMFNAKGDALRPYPEMSSASREMAANSKSE